MCQEILDANKISMKVPVVVVVVSISRCQECNINKNITFWVKESSRLSSNDSKRKQRCNPYFHFHSKSQHL